MSKVFKVHTKWIGYSEIIVEAKNKKEAETLVYKGKYDYLDESTTGNGLEYGYDNEEITNIEEVSKEEA
tara:strand:+ start:1370 stop:1576 length:207 start_codon:yes stop_codon:yes gene_type:complete